MMYQMGWQRLLIHQVPQGGGGGGAAAAPPPRDWTPEWNKVVDEEKAIFANVDDINSMAQKVQTESDWQADKATLNKKIDDTIAMIDDALAIQATIPSSWFGLRDADRQANIVTLTQTKTNLGQMRSTRTAGTYEFVQNDIARQLVQLQQMKRLIGKPIDPTPPTSVYPQGSWQYWLWTQGYALSEIAWAENDAKVKDLFGKYGSNFNLFKLEIQSEIDNALITGNLPITPDPVISDGSTTPTPPQPVINPTPGTASAIWMPMGYVIGVGTGLKVGQATLVTYSDTVQPTVSDVYSSTHPTLPTGYSYSSGPSNGKATGLGSPEGYCYDLSNNTLVPISRVLPGWSLPINGLTPANPYPTTVNYYGDPAIMGPSNIISTNKYSAGEIKDFFPAGCRYSSTTWTLTKVVSSGELIDNSVITQPGMTIGSESHRIIQRRANRSGYRRSFISQGNNDWVSPNLTQGPFDGRVYGTGIDNPNPIVGWCATNISNGKDNWESILIGQGATPDQLDTVRRSLASMRLKARANVASVAIAIWNNVKNGTLTTPTNVADLGNPLSTIPDVSGVALHQDYIQRQNILSQKQARRNARGNLRMKLYV